MVLSIKQALGMEKELSFISDSSLLDTEIILSFVMRQTREYVRAHDDVRLSLTEENSFRKFLERRKRGEPIAYIVGKCFFWDFELIANSSVLIPRPETERLVELAIELVMKNQRRNYIADLGTGSGAIAIALARAFKDSFVHAVDISEDALAVARLNANNLGVENIEFHKGSWFGGLPGKRFDLIVANPPYIKNGDEHLLKKELSYEPLNSLVSDDSGYAALNTIIDQSPKFLRKDAWLLLEHGYNQQEKVLDRLKVNGYSSLSGHQDLSGVDRVAIARWRK
ncbi:peptide chain release factor N(5)-glutamine methyltransferase [Gammaproteobacteria bacterium]|nr:peptide chain release factor N(5)-glutamine methyltransferase [Gammaproteobacteria bacterium]